MQEWVKALRSGKYKQTTGKLKYDNAYCCLGVLCDISNISEWESNGINETYLTNSSTPPLVVKIYAGINNSMKGINKLGELIRMNDSHNYNFKQIADYIEQNYESL